MGNLTPGATLVYEHVDGIIYSREMGADPATRKIVGYESGRDYDLIKRNKINWHDVVESSKDNKSLADAMDRVIMLYELSKVNE